MMYINLRLEEMFQCCYATKINLLNNTGNTHAMNTCWQHFIVVGRRKRRVDKHDYHDYVTAHLAHFSLLMTLRAFIIDIKFTFGY